MTQAPVKILRLEKYDVEHCSDSLSGMDAVESGTYDIIILDIMLSEMNEFKMAQNTRNEENCSIKKPYKQLQRKISFRIVLRHMIMI